MNWWLIGLGIVLLLPFAYVFLVYLAYFIFWLLSTNYIEYVIVAFLVIATVIGIYMVLVGSKVLIL